MHGSGFWILDPKLWILDYGFWILEFWIVDSGICILDAGSYILGSGFCIQDSGCTKGEIPLDQQLAWEGCGWPPNLPSKESTILQLPAPGSRIGSRSIGLASVTGKSLVKSNHIFVLPILIPDLHCHPTFHCHPTDHTY